MGKPREFWTDGYIIMSPQQSLVSRALSAQTETPATFKVIEHDAYVKAIAALKDYAAWTKDTQYLNDSGQLAEQTLRELGEME